MRDASGQALGLKHQHPFYANVQFCNTSHPTAASFGANTDEEISTATYLSYTLSWTSEGLFQGGGGNSGFFQFGGQKDFAKEVQHWCHFILPTRNQEKNIFPLKS